MTRWQDLTPAQVDALPTGPIQHERREITAEEMARGVPGKFVERAIRRKVKARSFAMSDPMFLCDSAGEPFMIGEYDDGSFYKEPLGF